MRPIVGISSYVAPASWGVWQEVPAALIPYAYVRRVTAAGGRAVILPPDDLDADVVASLDALVLAGGPDISPDLYGETSGPHTDSRPDRDRGELALLAAALDVDLPILGVCRGMQLLAVAYGGRLHQHLPDIAGQDEWTHRLGPGLYAKHGARFAPGSRIAEVMGEAAEVNSYHHQGVADPGRLTVTGWADDGLIEVLEDPAHRFVVGVQWHPEEDPDQGLFAALLRAVVRPG